MPNTKRIAPDWRGAQGGAARACRITAALALAGLFAAAPAWSAQGQDAPRASPPPGASADGAPPIGGAIVGGSIQRGGKEATPVELDRCRDLTGTLKAQCLRDARLPAAPPLPHTALGEGAKSEGAKGEEVKAEEANQSPRPYLF